MRGFFKGRAVGNTRGIEDRLSDALHDRITQRFVDRRSAFLMRHMAGDEELLASVDKAGAVCVEGTHVGRLDGFRFVPDASEGAAIAIASASKWPIQIGR